jgi:hypothetical protein
MQVACRAHWGPPTLRTDHRVGRGIRSSHISTHPSTGLSHTLTTPVITFRSADALIALAMLSLGGYCSSLPDRS